MGVTVGSKVYLPAELGVVQDSHALGENLLHSRDSPGSYRSL